MSWRVVVVSGNAKVDYKMDYLAIRKLDETRRVHITEIGVLILESTAISITAYAMCELIQHKVKVIFCDRQRNPLGEVMPLYGSHDTSDRVRSQVRWSREHKDLVWREIVRAKIKGQRDVLLAQGRSAASLLTGYLEQLTPGDATNREGHAAKVYFNALFGSGFSRDMDSPVNGALNYGYSLLLSAVNREIAASGYITQLGIFHDNAFNPYNLGCDFMEPLRPLVDHEVVSMRPESLGKDEKMALVRLLNREVRVDGRRHHLLYAIRLYCAGLFKALQSGNVEEIKMIEYEL